MVKIKGAPVVIELCNQDELRKRSLNPNPSEVLYYGLFEAPYMRISVLEDMVDYSMRNTIFHELIHAYIYINNQASLKDRGDVEEILIDFIVANLFDILKLYILSGKIMKKLKEVK